MTRVGMNPGRGKFSTYSPARVTAVVLVSIPHFAGYFEHRMSVLRACIDSLVGNTSIPMDLMVFDNGSCLEVQDYLQGLQRQGILRFLLRSRTNLGKIGALRMLIPAAPGEIIAYCDDDFYFFPRWLKAQLEILDTFPHVGMVSGYAIPSLFVQERISATLSFARGNQEVKLLEGKFIPEEWIRDWAVSTGRSPAEALADAAPLPEYILEYRGLPAFGAANHDQFIARKEVIQGCLPAPWSGKLMGEMLEMDRAVNRAGYLRLATRERTAQHLGNMLGDHLAERLPGLTPIPSASMAGGGQRSAWWKRAVRWPPLRWLLLGLYSKLFRLINPD